jgi:hypothetical protein
VKPSAPASGAYGNAAATITHAIVETNRVVLRAATKERGRAAFGGAVMQFATGTALLPLGQTGGTLVALHRPLHVWMGAAGCTCSLMR